MQGAHASVSMARGSTNVRMRLAYESVRIKEIGDRGFPRESVARS